MAARTIRLGVELTGEESYKSGLKTLENGLKNVAAAQAELNSRYGQGDNSMARAAQQRDILTAKLDMQRQKMELIKNEYEAVAAAEGENSESAQRLQRALMYAQAAVNNTERELQQLNERLNQSRPAMERFQAAMERGREALTKIGEKMGEIGKAMTTKLTAPIVAGATACVKSYMDLEDAMSTVATIADTSAVSMEDMTNATIEASSRTGVAAKSLAEAEYQAISAGVATADAVKFAEEAAKAAKAGLTDTTTVVNGVTSAMNAWKLETSEMTSVMDKMIMTQNFGKTSLGEIASQIGQVTGLAPQLNVSLDEVLAATAALTKNGVSTSSAINGMKAVMSAVLKPTADAGKCAKSLGLEFDAAAVKTKGFTGFLADVVEKTGGDETALARLFGSVESLSAIMALGGTAADSYAEALQLIGQSAGTMDAAFTTKTASKTEQLNKALNALRNEGIKLGAQLAPAVQLASDAMSKLAEIVGRLTPEQQRIAITIAAITAAIGPALVGISKLTTGIGNLMGVIGRLAPMLVGAGPIALLVAGIAAATAGVILLKRHLDSLNVKGTQRIQMAFSEVNIDTEAVNKAMEVAAKAAQDMAERQEIIVQAQTKLQADADDIGKQITAWLQGNQRKSKKKREEFIKEAEAAFQPAFDAIEEAYKAKKKSLDDMWNTPVISQEEYDAQLAQINLLTPGTTEQYSAAMEPLLKPIIDGIKARYDRERARLKAELGQGIITQEEYDAMLDSLNQLEAKDVEEAKSAVSGLFDVVYQGVVLAHAETRANIKSTLSQPVVTDEDRENVESQLNAIKTNESEVYNTAANNLFGPLYDGIKKAYDAKKSELDAALADGAITQAEYDKQLAELKEIKATDTAAVTAQATALFGPIFAGLLDEYNTKKSELDGKLADGAITQAEYDKQLTQLQAITISSPEAVNSVGDGLFASIFDGLSQAYDKKKAALDAKFKDGIFTQEEYDAQLSQLNLLTPGKSEEYEAAIEPLLKPIVDGIKAKYDRARADLKAKLGQGLITQEDYDGMMATIDQMEAKDVEEAKSAVSGLFDTVYQGVVLAHSDARRKIKQQMAQPVLKQADYDNLKKQMETIKADQNVAYATAATNLFGPLYYGISKAYTDKKSALDEKLKKGLISKSDYDAQVKSLKEIQAADTAEVTAQASALFGPIFAGIMAEYSKKKFALDNKLASGAITQAQYDKQLKDLENRTIASPEAVKSVGDSLFGSIFDTLIDSYDTKKAALDTKLTGGLISKEQYEAELKELDTITADQKKALEGELKAYTDYVAELSKQVTPPTEAQLAKLEELRQAVVNLATEILGATNTAKQAAEAHRSLVKAGYGTPEDVGIAVKLTQQDYADTVAAATKQRDETLANLQSALDTAETVEAKAEIKYQMSLVNENFETQKAAAVAEYTKQCNEMADGIAAAYPEVAAKMKEILGKQNLIESIMEQLTVIEDNGEGAYDAYTKLYAQLFPKDPPPPVMDAGVEQINQALDELKKSIAADVESTDFSGAFSSLSAGLEAGMTQNIDPGMINTNLKAMMTAMDLSDDGKTVGEQLISGEIAGIEGYQGNLNMAIVQGAEAGNKALRAKQGINSPSTVWRGYGMNLMQGMAIGIQSGTSAALSAISGMAGSLNSAGANSIQGLINGANSKRTALIRTYTSLAEDAIRAAKTKLKIHSPSKEFVDIGANTGDAMVGGIVSKVGKVRRAMQDMTDTSWIKNQKAQTAEPEIPRSADGGTSMHFQINYSGAATSREARKLAQQLGGYVNQTRRARGGLIR